MCYLGVDVIKKCLAMWIFFLECNGARILGIIPTASYSHQITFHPLWKELALRGHNVTVITTDPLKNSSLENLHEIDLGEMYGLFKKVKFYETIAGDLKYFWKIGLLLRDTCVTVTKMITENKEIKKLKKEQFDLVIGEAHFPSVIGFIGHFKCPWIGVSSMESGIQFNVAIGNPTHPILNPDYNLPLKNVDDLNILERIASFIYSALYVYLINSYIFPILTTIYEEQGWNSPPMVDVQNNISMLFVNTHPIFHNVRPILPNTISIGTGIHFKEPQPLPKFLSGAKILSVIPTASRAHHLPFQPLWRELALRGHQITVVTTDPQKNSSLKNLKEIDMSYCYKIYDKHNVKGVMLNETLSLSKILEILSSAILECNDYHMKSPKIQELINNENTKFDLLFVEAQLPAMLALGWRFKCPIIAVTSMDSAMQYHEALGNPIHPVINPDHNLDFHHANEMGFKERLLSFLYATTYMYFMYNKVYPKYHAQMKNYFGEDLPSLTELQDDISMMFIGVHPLFNNIRPLNPNTIPIASGMHINSPKELPNDLKKFLDEGKDGVIYFSLGSNVNSNLLAGNFKKAVIESFAEVPYKVLFKMDGEVIETSKNVLVRKWMPQQDILRHPNIKLFISQGGLQSLQESVVNGIPLIGIPFFGDQITNVNKMVKKGYGIKVDRKTITKEILKTAIMKIMSNSSYRETAQALGEIFRDEEMPSLQRAVYWTEYVIRHKGAKHLRSPAVGMPAWKYYMLDVLVCLGLLAFLVIFVTYYTLRLLLRLVGFMLRKDKPKEKMS